MTLRSRRTAVLRQATSSLKCNAVLDTDEPIFRNLEKLLLGCKGFLPFQDGKYRLFIDQAVDSADYALAVVEDMIIDGIAIESEKKEDKFNKVICKFPNPETNWQPDQAIWPLSSDGTYVSTFASEDGNEDLIEEIDLETVTDYYAARDFARIFCLRSRNALRAAFRCTSEALDVRVGDVISITHSTPDGALNRFRWRA